MLVCVQHFEYQVSWNIQIHSLLLINSDESFCKTFTLIKAYRGNGCRSQNIYTFFLHVALEEICQVLLLEVEMKWINSVKANKVLSRQNAQYTCKRLQLTS